MAKKKTQESYGVELAKDMREKAMREAAENPDANIGKVRGKYDRLIAEFRKATPEKKSESSSDREFEAAKETVCQLLKDHSRKLSSENYPQTVIDGIVDTMAIEHPNDPAYADKIRKKLSEDSDIKKNISEFFEQKGKTDSEKIQSLVTSAIQAMGALSPDVKLAIRSYSEDVWELLKKDMEGMDKNREWFLSEWKDAMESDGVITVVRKELCGRIINKGAASKIESIFSLESPVAFLRKLSGNIEEIRQALPPEDKNIISALNHLVSVILLKDIQSTEEYLRSSKGKGDVFQKGEKKEILGLLSKTARSFPEIKESMREYISHMSEIILRYREKLPSQVDELQRSVEEKEVAAV